MVNLTLHSKKIQGNNSQQHDILKSLSAVCLQNTVNSLVDFQIKFMVLNILKHFYGTHGTEIAWI